MFSVRNIPIVGNEPKNSVYFYHVASDVCEYVTQENGKQVLHSQVTSDCCEYGIVAVDRATAKSYWFSNKKAADTFKAFVRDEELHPDSSEPTLFTALYLELVWGGSRDHEITSLGQLRDLAQGNFQSAYASSEKDDVWQHKFDVWWRHFRSKMPQVKLETTYEPASEGTTVRGYAFSGFNLTIPQSDPPPKGTPQLFQWSLLVKPDGTVEEQPSRIIYSSR